MSNVQTNLIWTATDSGYESGPYSLGKTPGRRWVVSFNGEQIGKAFGKLSEAESFADVHANANGFAPPAVESVEPETFPLTDVAPVETVAETPIEEPATVVAETTIEEPAGEIAGEPVNATADVETQPEPQPEPSPAVEPPANRPTVKTQSKFYAKWAAAGTPQPFRGETGKLFTIVKILKEAGASGNYVTKEDVLDKMKVAFPEDDPIKMEVTIRNQIPCRLRLVRGLFVWQQRTGSVTRYWIDPTTGGFAEQPADVPKVIRPDGTQPATKPTAAPVEPEPQPEPTELPESF